MDWYIVASGVAFLELTMSVVLWRFTSPVVSYIMTSWRDRKRSESLKMALYMMSVALLCFGIIFGLTGTVLVHADQVETSSIVALACFGAGFAIAMSLTFEAPSGNEKD